MIFLKCSAEKAGNGIFLGENLLRMRTPLKSHATPLN